MRQMEEIGLIGFGINTATREKYVGGKLLAGWEERIQRRTPSSRRERDLVIGADFISFC